MQLYNSYTQQTEDLKPLEEGKISIYVCGPTVYNDPHIGNARPIAVFDTLIKALKAQGYDVTFASNYTDVDDKIINKAIEEGVGEKDITDRYITSYRAVRKGLNADEPDYAPRVTETMDRIIEFIQELIDCGAAYVVDGDVYYSVESNPKYGELSHQKLDDLMVGARIDENEKKRNPLDFTLWKQTEQGIQWPTEWSNGRPGWHTECVVMINDVFKKPLIDIHGGGADLRFPHHENEMAQSESCHNTPLANMWVHNGMININGKKMSKSDGNIISARELIDEYGTQAVRWGLISTHYRAPLNLKDDTFENAQKELDKIVKPLQKARMLMAVNEYEPDENALNEELWNEFTDALNDDLNTPNAIATVFAGIKTLNSLIRSAAPEQAALTAQYNTLIKMLHVLGIDMSYGDPEAADVEAWKNWKKAVKEKEFETADQNRKVLMDKGWI